MNGTFRCWAAGFLLVFLHGVFPALGQSHAVTTHAKDSPEAFVLGVCTHFAQDKGVLSSNLSVIEQAGIGSIRDEVYWRAVEPEQGKLKMPAKWDRYLRQADIKGLKPMLILNYGNQFYDKGHKPTSPKALDGFVRYAKFVVDHFKGRVPLYEVWNEYDIGIGTPGDEGGTPEEYVQLLQRTYSAIKKVDSSITVLGGAMTPGGVGNGWLEGILQQGALKYADALSLHTYIYSAKGRARSPEAWARWMQEVQKMLRGYNKGKPVPLYITEMGWPTHQGERGTPPSVSADYLARMYLLARTLPFLKGLWWYDFQDDGWDPKHNEHNFGLVRPDLTPKPAYHAVRDLADLVTSATYKGRLQTQQDDLWILTFERPSGQQTWALWSADPKAQYQVLLEQPDQKTDASLLLQQVGRQPVQLPWGYRAWTKDMDTLNPHQISVTASSTPLLLSGPLEQVSVQHVQKRGAPGS